MYISIAVLVILGILSFIGFMSVIQYLSDSFEEYNKIYTKISHITNNKATSWGCPDCCTLFDDGIPEKCPYNATGCDELLIKGK